MARIRHHLSEDWDIFRDGKVINQTRKAACFGSLFGFRFQKGDILKVYWWHEEEKAKDMDESNWYVEQFLIPRMPGRMKGCFKLTHDVPPLSPLNQPGPHWITLEIELDKVTPNDLYIFLSLFRYPQENPDFVGEMSRILAEEGDKITEDVAWLLAHNKRHSGTGHMMMTGSGFWWIKNQADKLIGSKWSLANVWENIPKMTYEAEKWNAKGVYYVKESIIGSAVPATENIRKTYDLSRYFAEFGQDHDECHKKFINDYYTAIRNGDRYANL